MTVDRLKRVNELLRREIGESLYHVMGETDFDFSTVTITHVITHRDLRQARVLVSIRAPEATQRQILSLIRKHRAEIQRRINKDLVLKYTPRLFFEIDASVAEGNRVLDLLAKLERDRPHEDAAEAPGGDMERDAQDHG